MGVCLLTANELADATLGAMYEKDSAHLYTYLVAKRDALDRAMGDPAPEDNESPSDDEPNPTGTSQAAELSDSRVGLVEIPFGHARLVDQIATCIAVGNQMIQQEADELIRRKEVILNTEQRVQERNRRRQRFDGRPAYLRLVEPPEN